MCHGKRKELDAFEHAGVDKYSKCFLKVNSDGNVLTKLLRSVVACLLPIRANTWVYFPF